MSQTLPQQENSDALGGLQQPVATEIKEVERILFAEMRADVPWMNQLLNSSSLAQGKRMRPMLLLLAGAQTGQLTEAHFAMAAAVEMVHVATLVHDDVIDEAEVRRHQPTVNHQHGPKVSVLLGDYLFTHAFSVSTRSRNIDAISILAHAGNRLCEGEMRQNHHQGDLHLKQSEYLEIISDKTAELVAAACHLGAILSGANEHVCAGFEKYGRDLGIAFQIIDDILDIDGSFESMGKTLGTDAASHKLTLPLIHCRNTLNDQDQSDFLTFLTTDQYSPQKLVKWLQKTESLEYAKNVARTHVNDAMEFAKTLESGPYATALTRTAEFILKRTF